MRTESTAGIRVQVATDLIVGVEQLEGRLDPLIESEPVVRESSNLS